MGAGGSHEHALITRSFWPQAAEKRMPFYKTPENFQGPKCSRCGYHGIIVRTKGHRNKCPFLKCRCWKCELIQQRSRITALQRRIDGQSRSQRPNPRMDVAAAATDKAVEQANGAAEAPEKVATSDCCPLDLRTRRDVTTAAGYQVQPQGSRGEIRK